MHERTKNILEILKYSHKATLTLASDTIYARKKIGKNKNPIPEAIENLEKRGDVTIQQKTHGEETIIIIERI